MVITEWDWADPKAYLHDEVSTDRRDPTRNANGLIYGSLELSADYLPVLDPKTPPEAVTPSATSTTTTTTTTTTTPEPTPAADAPIG